MAAPIQVELHGAPLPYIGWLAHHYWLEIQQGEQWERWEVWQRPGRGQLCSGHLYRDLLPSRCGVGGGDSWCQAVWQGKRARALAARARASFDTYPWCDRYRYWPGPNSNTYVQWLLQDLYRLPARAVGRNYIVVI